MLKLFRHSCLLLSIAAALYLRPSKYLILILAIFAVIFSTFFIWITTDSNTILDINIFKISFNFWLSFFLYEKHFYKLHHNTCNKILLIFMHTLYCTYLHLQKGKISSEVWTKSDNHRDCVVLRPRCISLVIVRVSPITREKERDRCVYIHKGELPSGASQWLYLSLKHFHNCLLLHYHSLSPSLSFILFEEKRMNENTL